MKHYHPTLQECVGAAFLLAAAASCAPSPKPTLPAIASATPLPSIPSPSPPPDPDVIVDSHMIAAVQRTLRVLGYNAGEPDGINGSATRRAILAFQKDHSLPQDGLLTTAVADKLRTLQADRMTSLSVGAGDILIYDDGSTETVVVARELKWEQKDGLRSLMAIRPSTDGWPAAARTGLDWATTHALDGQTLTPSTRWSSSGVGRQFEIKVFPALSPREAMLVGGFQLCRRFEMRAEQRRRYPGLACRDVKGEWNIPHSQIRFARPATGLGKQPELATIP
jgi:hypothetical protein